MNILKTKRTKMSLDAIKNCMSRDEMKGIIAGSGYVNFMQGSNYMTNQNVWNISMSGSSGNAAYSSMSSYMSSMNNTSSSYATSNSTSTSTWAINANGNYATSNPAAMTIFFGMLASGTHPTDCVFQSMAYLAGLYGNSSLNLNSMQNNYNSLYSGAISAGIIPPASGGVDAALLSGFVDQYFNRVGGVTTFAQLNSFIAAGGSNFAIGTYSTGTGTSHAVVITGITANGTQYICTDPQNNIVGLTIDKNRFTGFVAINGGCR